MNRLGKPSELATVSGMVSSKEAWHSFVTTMVLICGCGSAEVLSPVGGGGASTATGTSESTTSASSASGMGGQGGNLLAGDCDPLVPSLCGLPFPSNVWLMDDPQQPSKKSVRFGPTTLPATQSGVHMAPDDYFDHDGFSPAAAPMTHMPGATVSGCATPYDIPRSLAADSPTILLEVSSGRRVPHWVDLDMSTSNDATRAFMLRPAERLIDGERYIVAIRNIVDSNGMKLQPTPVFAALRAGSPLTEGTDEEKYSVQSRLSLYQEMFTKLEAAGVARDELQLVWDFSTASTDNNTRYLLSMRDKALALVGETGPSFEFLSTEEFPTPADNPFLLRRVEVKMTVPLYLTSSKISFELNEPSAVLNLDQAGELQQNGTMDMTVMIHVPRSVLTGAPHGILQNGHGLFGTRDQRRNGFFAKTTNRDHFVGVTINYFGFDKEAQGFATQVLLGRQGGFRSLTERQLQGMVNQLLAMRMMIGGVAKKGVSDGTGQLLVDPKWIDPAVRGYRGDSQGGIMGATYMAVTTDVTRGLLGEPGMPYSMLLNRSVEWVTYDAVLKQGFGDNGLTEQLNLNLVQMKWDRVEPSGFAHRLQNNPFPGTPTHAVILHLARGDHQVSTFGAHILARAIGAKQLASNDPAQPVFETPFGIATVSAPVSNQSVMVEYDFGVPKNPAVNLPQMEGCDPHDRVHTLEPSFDQQNTFIRTGVAQWFCNGACNCTDTGPDPKQELGCAESFADQCE